MAEQPNFNTLSASVTATSNGLAVAATEMQKMQNIPVVNLATQMTRMEERLVRELRKMDHNHFARMINSKVTNDTTPLEALLGQNGQPVQNFPATTSEIHDLDDAGINDLLGALGLPLGGRINERKNRFRRHIGLTVL